MIYLDTSVAVAMLTAEERSNEAIGWFEQCTTSLISCDWLMTETHNALALKQRLYWLSATDVQAAARQFDRLLQAGVELMSMERERFRNAADLLQEPSTGLRAGDALHLAVALHSRCTHLASFDRRLQAAASSLGLSPALA